MHVYRWIALFLTSFTFSPLYTTAPFPRDFLWGVALSEYQNSGALHCPYSNWAQWEKSKQTGHYSGCASNFWLSYKEDIRRMKKDLGITSLRISIEWSTIEPYQGYFDHDALHHYQDICAFLQSQHIEPMITLHHFTHPQWFEHKKGFELQENIAYFVRFAQRVFDALSMHAHLWCTINEPAIYVLQGYMRGVYPPGKKSLIPFVPSPLALTVLGNLLEAHVRVYNTLKATPQGSTAQIGLVHQYLRFEPYSAWNLLERMPCALINQFLNDSVLRFCSTGHFTYNLKNIHKATYTAPAKTKILDFLGLNYYSRVLLTLRPGHPLSSCYAHETMTDMPYALYAAGLFNALKKTARIGVPIYITESGIADAQDTRRELFIKEYIAAVHDGLKAGFPIRGFYYWTFVDNFEWDMGYSQQFGLYTLDRHTQERVLKPGGHSYARIIQEHAT